MPMLQELLNLGLVAIGPDDSRFEKMTATVAAFSVQLKSQPRLLVPSTLIALDNEASESDGLFDMVENLVIAEWRTLRNTHVSRPRELLRSIIIAGLAAAAADGPERSAIISNTATSPLRHGQFRLGSERSLVMGLIENSCRAAENAAVAFSSAKISQVKPRKKKSSADRTSMDIDAAIEVEEFLPEVGRASGPSFGFISTMKEPNGHWPNSGQAWANDFVPKMTEALVNAVNSGTSRITSSLQENLDSYVSVLESELLEQQKHIDSAFREALESISASKMRLDVLWWSQALYSSMFGRSYRDLPLVVSTVASALDLSAITPPLAPASVTYVLGETVHRLTSLVDGPSTWTLATLLGALASHSNLFVDQGLSELPSTRCSLFALIRHAYSGNRMSADEIREKSGLDPELVLSAAEVAMWIFRDVQAERLAEVEE